MKRELYRLALLLLTLLTVAISLRAQSVPTYTITVFSPLPGDTTTEANSRTDAGMVIGRSGNGSSSTAVYWSGSSTPTALDNGSYTWVSSSKTNSTGTVIIGYSSFEGGSGALAWRQNVGGYSSVYVLPSSGGSWTSANGVNTAGTIVGESSTSGDAASSAAIWTWNGSSYSASALTAGSFAFNSANAINSAGTIVGYTYLNDVSQALVWASSSSSHVVLASLGGTNDQAAAINDSGLIVGYSTTSTAVERAALWTLNETSGTYIVTDLGALSATGSSHAYAISSSGVAVGDASTVSSQQHATYYYNGTAYDLNDYVTLASGYYLSSATGINDLGQILATMTNGTTSYGVLLTISAVPEPATCAALLGLGALGLVTYRRRRT